MRDLVGGDYFYTPANFGCMIYLFLLKVLKNGSKFIDANFVHFRIHWCIIAAPAQTPKLAIRTTGRDKCFLKQKKATRKKKILGSIPQRAPFVNSCMIFGLPLFSRYIHTRTNAPVRGMTPTRPAVDGNFFPIAVATRMMATLKTIFNKICINVVLLSFRRFNPGPVKDSPVFHLIIMQLR